MWYMVNHVMRGTHQANAAGVGYDVEADGRRVAKMSEVFRSVLFTCTSAKMLFAGFASNK